MSSKAKFSPTDEWTTRSFLLWKNKTEIYTKIISSLTAAIISNGGTKTNIIPEEAQIRVQIRALTLPDFRTLTTKVEACCRAAALATGCEVWERVCHRAFRMWKCLWQCCSHTEIWPGANLVDTFLSDWDFLDGKAVSEHRNESNPGGDIPKECTFNWFGGGCRQRPDTTGNISCFRLLQKRSMDWVSKSKTQRKQVEREKCINQSETCACVKK